MLLDLTHTSHTRARTGIQRVARALWNTFGAEAQPICRDPYLRAWRPLKPWELANLAIESAAPDRSARWPLRARLRGLFQLGGTTSVSSGLKNLTARPQSLLVPEFFSPAVAAALPSLFAAVPGPHAALFFDAVALKYPELTPVKTVGRYPAYLAELAKFDGIAAISGDSRDTLIDYWKWLGLKEAPPVVAIPLGVDAPRKIQDPNLQIQATGHPPLPSVLSVGSLEGRKNHLALLEACEQLWAEGRRFELRLIGMVHPQTGRPAAERVAALRQAGRPLRHDVAAGDDILAEAYAASAFTIYPSLMEGFGMPVTESLTYGKPCICSARGALGEISRGGGCLALETMDAPSLAAAIRRLLANPDEFAALAAAARARRFRTWTEYATEIRDWMKTLRGGSKAL